MKYGIIWILCEIKIPWCKVCRLLLCLFRLLKTQDVSLSFLEGSIIIDSARARNRCETALQWPVDRRSESRFNYEPHAFASDPEVKQSWQWNIANCRYFKNTDCRNGVDVWSPTSHIFPHLLKQTHRATVFQGDSQGVSKGSTRHGCPTRLDKASF